MTTLVNEDLVWCLRRLSKPIRDLLKARAGKLVVAGGFARACVAREAVNDVDLFSPSADAAKACAFDLAKAGGKEGRDLRIIETDNAITVLSKPFPCQFIHRWTFAKPEDIVPSFDFTIAKAAFWYDGKDWQSLVDDRFYADLAAKRLVYCAPVRAEEAGGSMLRILKFYQRGYRIPLDSLGAVVARLLGGVDMGMINELHLSPEEREMQIAKVLTGLLREVDPNIDPEHISHLPAMNEEPAAIRDAAKGES